MGENGQESIALQDRFPGLGFGGLEIRHVGTDHAQKANLAAVAPDGEFHRQVGPRAVCMRQYFLPTHDDSLFQHGPIIGREPGGEIGGKNLDIAPSGRGFSVDAEQRAEGVVHQKIASRRVLDGDQRG